MNTQLHKKWSQTAETPCFTDIKKQYWHSHEDKDQKKKNWLFPKLPCADAWLRKLNNNTTGMEH